MTVIILNEAEKDAVVDLIEKDFWTQEEVAEHFGVSTRTVGRILDERKFELEVFEGLAVETPLQHQIPFPPQRQMTFKAIWKLIKALFTYKPPTHVQNQKHIT